MDIEWDDMAGLGGDGFNPDNRDQALSPMFACCSNMLHNGIEWPLEIRQKFANRIKNDA